MPGAVFLKKKNGPLGVHFQNFVYTLVDTHGIAVCEFAQVGTFSGECV